jgi:hypothetical protein
VVDAAQQPNGVLAVARDLDLPPPLCVAVRVAAASAQVAKERVADRGSMRFLVAACGFF